MKKNWYSITNKSADTAEISIYDAVGLWGISAKDFIDELKAAGDRKIKLRLNCPGGDVFDGLAIYNRLKDHAPGVEVVIDGLAASMGSVIAMAGGTITMAENALFMIHNPAGMCAGESSDMRDLAALLDKVKSSIVNTYEARLIAASAKEVVPPCDIAALMDAETWFTAAEAKAAGFCDTVAPALKMAARFDTSKFRNAPNLTNSTMILRTSILAALSLTDPDGGQPITDAEITNFVTRAVTAEKTVATLTADLDTARKSFTDAQTKLTAAESKAAAESGKFTNLTAEVKAALALTDEQVTNLVSDKTVLPMAVTAVAMKKAVEIAASQGIPPVPMKPGAASADDLKAEFETAAAEPDPRKRGMLFAAIDARLAAKTHGKN